MHGVIRLELVPNETVCRVEEHVLIVQNGNSEEIDLLNQYG